MIRALAMILTMVIPVAAGNVPVCRLSSRISSGTAEMVVCIDSASAYRPSQKTLDAMFATFFGGCKPNPSVKKIELTITLNSGNWYWTNGVRGVFGTSKTTVVKQDGSVMQFSHRGGCDARKNASRQYTATNATLREHIVYAASRAVLYKNITPEGFRALGKIPQSELPMRHDLVRHLLHQTHETPASAMEQLLEHHSPMARAIAVTGLMVKGHAFDPASIDSATFYSAGMGEYYEAIRERSCLPESRWVALVQREHTKKAPATPATKENATTKETKPLANRSSEEVNRHSDRTSSADAATVFISSIPPVADVYMDGKYIGKTNLKKLHVMAGKRIVRFVKGSAVLEKEFTFVPGANPSMHINISTSRISGGNGDR